MLVLFDLNDAHVFQKDTEANEGEDDAACQLGAAFVFRTEDVANFHADGREEERGDTDEGDRPADADVGENGERNANRKRVNTGGNRHEEHFLCRERSTAAASVLFVVTLEGLHDHFAAEEAKQILTDNRSLLDEIAEHLLLKETITGDELMAFVNAPKAEPAEEPAEGSEE